jgi:hypothetical protein
MTMELRHMRCFLAIAEPAIAGLVTLARGIIGYRPPGAT